MYMYTLKNMVPLTSCNSKINEVPMEMPVFSGYPEKQALVKSDARL